MPTWSFGQDLPIFPTETATGAALRDGPWRELFVPGHSRQRRLRPQSVAEADPPVSVSGAPSRRAAAHRVSSPRSNCRFRFRGVSQTSIDLGDPGIGAGGALLAHPVDDEVNAKLVGSPAVGRFFAPGKVIGSAWVQVGVSVGLYVVGRYVMPHKKEKRRPTRSRTSVTTSCVRKSSSQALVHGIKYAGPSRSSHRGVLLVSFRPCRDRVCCRVGARAAPGIPGCMADAASSAAYVGASRLHDNRHFLSDVVFGSAIRHGHRLDDCREARPIRLRAAADARARGIRVEPDADASTARGTRCSKV